MPAKKSGKKGGKSPKKTRSEEQVPAELLSSISLDLAHSSPEEIVTQLNDCQRFVSLVNLDLSFNALVELPTAIGALSHLVELNLGYNRLSALPESLGDLKRLQQLWLNWNVFSEFPLAVLGCSDLVMLQLECNGLTALPSSISSLSLLQHLNASYNCLKSVPPEICSLRDLESLFLDWNEISDLEDLHTEAWTDLQVLSLRGNKLVNLCDCSALKSLKTLDVGSDDLEMSWRRNLLTSLPDSIGCCVNLTRLDLSGNQIQQVPQDLAELPNLKELNLRENPITAVPMLGKLMEHCAVSPASLKTAAAVIPYMAYPVN